MHDTIKNKKINHRRRFTCVNSRELSTTVVRMYTRVYITKRQNKTSTICIEINTDIKLEDFSKRINIIND